MSHRVQVQMSAEAGCFPQVEEDFPALLNGLDGRNFKIVERLEWIVLERRISTPACVCERIEIRLKEVVMNNKSFVQIVQQSMGWQSVPLSTQTAIGQ